MNRFGLNIVWEGDARPDILDIYRQSRAPWAVVINNPPLCDAIRQVSPTTKVSYRVKRQGNAP